MNKTDQFFLIFFKPQHLLLIVRRCGNCRINSKTCSHDSMIGDVRRYRYIQRHHRSIGEQYRCLRFLEGKLTFLMHESVIVQSKLVKRCALLTAAMRRRRKGWLLRGQKIQKMSQIRFHSTFSCNLLVNTCKIL